MGNVCSESRQAVQKSSASAIFRNTYKNVSFENISGDICAQQVDAIINAANNQLAHNNGLANSILLKGGNIIQDESDKFMAKTDGILDVGTAVITSAGNLPSKYVIHIVSPVWNGGDNGEEEKLANAVINALAKADEYKVTTLAVPCLSAGGFGFPTGKCATVMVKSFVEYLDSTPDTHLTLVRFVNMNNSTAKAFKAELEKRLGRNISLPNSKASIKASVRSQRQAELDFAEHGLLRHPEQQKLENENRGSNQGNNDTFDNQEPERLPVPTSYSEGPEGGISYPGRSPIERGQDPQE